MVDLCGHDAMSWDDGKVGKASHPAFGILLVCNKVRHCEHTVSDKLFARVEGHWSDSESGNPLILDMLFHDRCHVVQKL